MSDIAKGLLTRGIAAAKANDRRAARLCLEQVLCCDDAAMDEQANAWLWLSQVADDLTQRRVCLQNVLTLDPTHLLARRGLAILDSLPTSTKVDDQQHPVLPSLTPASSSVRQYLCLKCGGTMTFDSARRALTCDYCGHKMWEYEAVMKGALVAEKSFVATLPTAKAHQWELAIGRLLTCQGCGAGFVLPSGEFVGNCPYCGSGYVIEPGNTSELIQPDGILPFQFDADTAVQHVHAWLEQQHFRPHNLGEASVSSPRGVYMPFWSFDVSGDVVWHVVRQDDLGTRLWELMEAAVTKAELPIEPPLADNPEVREVSAGIYGVDHKDILFPASHSLPAYLLNDLTDFDIRSALRYSPELLVGWAAEVYQVPLANASLVVRQRAVEEARAHVPQIMGTLTIDSRGVEIRSYKLIMVPVWVVHYRYEGQDYLVAVNGQTGKVMGDMPRSGFQKTLANLEKAVWP